MEYLEIVLFCKILYAYCHTLFVCRKKISGNENSNNSILKYLTIMIFFMVYAFCDEYYFTLMFNIKCVCIVVQPPEILNSTENFLKLGFLQEMLGARTLFVQIASCSANLRLILTVWNVEMNSVFFMTRVKIEISFRL